MKTTLNIGMDIMRQISHAAKAQNISCSAMIVIAAREYPEALLRGCERKTLCGKALLCPPKIPRSLLRVFYPPEKGDEGYRQPGFHGKIGAVSGKIQTGGLAYLPYYMERV